MPDEKEKEALRKLDINICISTECDEQWSFVGNKKNKRWLWYILEKKSRKVLAFVFGKRDNATYQRFVDLLPRNLIDLLDTDNWRSYQSIPLAPIHRIGKAYTWRIERKNLDLRTRIKRLNRRTICFSIPIAIGTETIHDAVIGRFINLYLF